MNIPEEQGVYRFGKDPAQVALVMWLERHDDCKLTRKCNSIVHRSQEIAKELNKMPNVKIKKSLAKLAKDNGLIIVDNIFYDYSGTRIHTLTRNVVQTVFKKIIRGN